MKSLNKSSNIILTMIIFSLLMLANNKLFASHLVVNNSHCCVLNNNTWQMRISALYLQPSFGGNGLGYSSFGNYAGADNQQVIRTHNGVNYIYNVSPKQAWGFQLGGTYHYCMNNDIQLDWYHLNENVYGHLPHGSLFSGSIDGFYAGRLQVATKWDAVNLELGHEMNLFSRELLRLHGGLAFASIRNTFTNYPKLFLNSSPYFRSVDTLSYTGAGPRLGADFKYAVCRGLSLYAKTAGSLLIGSAKQTIDGYRDVTNNIYGRIPFGTNNFRLSNNNVIVPELEAKLGVAYDYKLPCGNLGLDLGYMWMTYLRSIVGYTGMGVVGSSLGVPTTTHFDLNGVYLSGSWSFF